MSINTREILSELVGMTEAGSSEARLVAVAFKVAFCVCGDHAVVAYSVIGLTKPMYARSFKAGLQDAKFHCNMPSTLFAFFFTSSTCLDQLNVHVICNPRYFLDVTPSKRVSLSTYVNGYGWRFRVIDIL